MVFSDERLKALLTAEVVVDLLKVFHILGRKGNNIFKIIRSFTSSVTKYGGNNGGEGYEGNERMWKRRTMIENERRLGFRILGLGLDFWGWLGFMMIRP